MEIVIGISCLAIGFGLGCWYSHYVKKENVVEQPVDERVSEKSEPVMDMPYKLVANIPPDEIIGPATASELLEGWKAVQLQINANEIKHEEFGTGLYKPFAIVCLRKEAADTLALKIMEDNPKAITRVVDWSPESNFSEERNCEMRQLVVAFDVRTHKDKVKAATDW